jgi:hypothetical protein
VAFDVLFCLDYRRQDPWPFRIGFALCQEIGVEPGCTMLLAPNTERDTNGCSPWPCSGEASQSSAGWAWSTLRGTCSGSVIPLMSGVTALDRWLPVRHRP